MDKLENEKKIKGSEILDPRPTRKLTVENFKVFGLNLEARPIANEEEMLEKIGLRQSGRGEVIKKEKTTSEQISMEVETGQLEAEQIFDKSHKAIENTNIGLTENEQAALEMRNVLAELFNETEAISAGHSQKVFELKNPKELARLNQDKFRDNEQNRAGDNIPDAPYSHFFVISKSAGELLINKLKSFNSSQFKVTKEFENGNGFMARLNGEAVGFLCAENGVVGGGEAVADVGQKDNADEEKKDKQTAA